MILGEQPGTEIAFGGVGVFWRPEIEWHDVEREDFAAFVEPGFGKIACNFSVRRPMATARRCSPTNVAPRPPTKSRGCLRFARYWRLIRPFVAHIMRATVRTIRDGRRAGDARGLIGQAGETFTAVPYAMSSW